MNTKTIALVAISGALSLVGMGTAEACNTAKPRPPVVTIFADDHSRIDVSPPQRLDVVYNRGHVPARYAQAWGGDASLAWATNECLDMGGTPVWRNGQVLTCRGVDY